MADTVVYIYGPQKLQNELLAAYIERETGTRCLTAHHDLPKSASNGPAGDSRELILLDCAGTDTDACLEAFQADYGNFSRGGCWVALFNVIPSPKLEKKALERGIRGFFYAEDSLERLSKGVCAILAGELWVSRDILTTFFLENKKDGQIEKRPGPKLTSRETEILALVSAGAGNEEIADRLCISPHTVKTHIYNIFKKINVPNRLQAALWAVKNL